MSEKQTTAKIEKKKDKTLSQQKHKGIFGSNKDRSGIRSFMLAQLKAGKVIK